MKKHLFLDIETNGLNLAEHDIFELGAIITNNCGDKLDEFHFIVSKTRESIDKMNSICLDMHTNNGLIKDVLSIDPSHTMECLDIDFCAFIKKHYFACNYNAKGPTICGTSVAFDKKFIEKYLPNSHNLISFRIVDTFTLDYFFGNVKRDLIYKYCELDQAKAHRCLSDVQTTIRKYFYYHHLLCDLTENKNIK